ncbi:hypothetical protein CRYUN_Cryun33cG0027400 [Craigia yunnanensis]
MLMHWRLIRAHVLSAWKGSPWIPVGRRPARMFFMGFALPSGCGGKDPAPCADLN